MSDEIMGIKIIPPTAEETAEIFRAIETVRKSLVSESQKQHETELQNKLNELGLYKSTKEILDNIVEENRGLMYVHYSLMCEWCCDILKLIELSERGRK